MRSSSLCVLIISLVVPGFGKGEPAAVWKIAFQVAEKFVSSESPPGIFGFQPAGAQEGVSNRIVVAHYFPPYPLSFDNKPSRTDYYSLGYLSPEGEGGKYKKVGGYLRSRPIPVGPWDTAVYEQVNLAIEVLRAEKVGIDAFGVDILDLPKGRLWSFTMSLCEAAAHAPSHFAIIPEPDMTALRTVTVQELADALQSFAACPAVYHSPDGKLLVMPFAAEVKNPGYWESLRLELNRRGLPATFIFDFVAPPQPMWKGDGQSGVSIWGSRDPSYAPRLTFFAQLGTEHGFPNFVAPVGAEDYRPRSGEVWESRNTEALRALWQTAIDRQFYGVHIVTWNDYSETSEISPNSASGYVFYDLCAYYIAWFKAGHRPAVASDVIYVTYRATPLVAQSGSGVAPLRRRGGSALTDDLEVVVLLKNPATVTIKTATNTKLVRLPGGLSAIRLAASEGSFDVAVSRNGALEATLRGRYPQNAGALRSDASYVGFSSSRTYRPAFAN